MRIVDEIPDALRPEVDAALAWLNAEQGRSFSVSGIVDPEHAESARGAPDDIGSRALRAVPVALALVTYAAIAVPGIVAVHRSFQSVES